MEQLPLLTSTPISTPTPTPAHENRCFLDFILDIIRYLARLFGCYSDPPPPTVIAIRPSAPAPTPAPLPLPTPAPALEPVPAPPKKTPQTVVFNHFGMLTYLVSFLSPKELAVTKRVSKAFRDRQNNFNGAHSAFFNITEIEVAKFCLDQPYHRIYLKLPASPGLLVNGNSPAFHACYNGFDDLGAYFLKQGGVIAISKDNAQYAKLHTRIPEVVVAICQVGFYNTSNLYKQILIYHNTIALQWIIQEQAKLKIPLSSFVRNFVYDYDFSTGFDDFIRINLEWLRSEITEVRAKYLMTRCLRYGYPKILQLFIKHGFPIEAENQQQANALLACKPSTSRAFIDPGDSNAHGGKATEDLYQREFQDAVSYAKYYIVNKEESFKILIENLGKRRKRMAILGRFEKVSKVSLFGEPTDKHTHTSFTNHFAKYGERIRARYPQLPIEVTMEIDGKTILMTFIEKGQWLHPDGRDRETILNHVSMLCEKIEETQYTDPKILARDLARVYWILSHYPVFKRGIRTVIEILVDALWELKFPDIRRNKRVDLNCEALVFDKCEDYIQHVLQNNFMY